MAGIALPEETRVDFIALKVANLAKVSQWYQQVARLDLLRQNGDTIYLGTRLNQQVLVVLHQIKGLSPQKPVTGLDHFAILLPNPGALGAAYRIVKQDQPVTKAFQTGYQQGFLAKDPEGNGVAFTIDRAIEQYQEERQYNWEDETEEAIDPAEIGKHAARDYDRLPSGTTIGYVQFRVADLASTSHYLEDGLGFREKPSPNTGEVFLAAGDYRHHIGINLRLEATLLLPTPDMYGLDYVSFILPDKMAMENILMNLDAAGLTDYDYHHENQFLMIAGPNRLTLWFRVA
ncbi:ring-cleaving dioxygenase [Lacticaseibacillus casei]|nr:MULTISPECIES: VOC family protein [Lacticaseibacillus]KLI76238.1 ring-cleavage extradiol dioxygenase [Lacticaseibacillus casei]OLS09286.1 ring-cleaving dioxygenase [Lacticaseibacillus casei]QVI33050.1 ring-cleaving dioxygenase [Lacticaseibacillus zeae]TLF43640.1 ring-cleaving dioxygenase [Lacticaseibacillus zeae]